MAKEIQNNVIGHARQDLSGMLDDPGLHRKAEHNSPAKGVGAWIRRNHAKQPSFMSQLSAMVREGIKDVRATIMESYFGKPEHPGEPVHPLNPTAQVVTAEMGIDYAESLGNAVRTDRHRGHELTR